MFFDILWGSWWSPGPEFGEKICQICKFWLPESWIFKLEPQYCVETSLMTIYGPIWLKLICQHAFLPVLGFMVISRTKNLSNYDKNTGFALPSKSWISNLVPWYYYETSSITIYGECMIDTNMPAHVLT